MDARPRAPGVEHHGVEDAAVVGGSAESGQDAGQIQKRTPKLGSVLARSGQQDQQEERGGGGGGGGGLHLCSSVMSKNPGSGRCSSVTPIMSVWRNC